MSHTGGTVWHRVVGVYMGFSAGCPWRWLGVKILNKNGLFAPGVVVLLIGLDLGDCFEFRYSLYGERAGRGTSVGAACRTGSGIPG